MMDYFEIQWKRSATREIRNVDQQYIPRLILAVEALKENPFPQGYRKLKNSEQIYRIRIGEFRIIYQVDAKRKILYIIHVRHRRDTYKA